MLEPAHVTADAVRAGTRSARAEAEAAIARIAARNPRINAFVHVDPDAALRDAAAVDAAVARGEDPGPLAGVVIGVKDLEPVGGMPWTSGSKAYAGRMAAEDSVQVARLKAAGAVVVGKTNTPEFGYKGFTENRLFGATGNPWDPARTPGGSSGGSAAAVADGMVAMCTGSDGGGSIRIPASCVGCYGIKPTAGRIPMAGETYPHWATHSTLGPLTRTVRDAARYLDAAAGAHPNDLNALDAPPGGHEAAVLAGPPRIERIAWSRDWGYAAVDPGVADAAFEGAKALAAALGAELVDANPGFEDPLAAWFAIGGPGDSHFVDTLTEEQRAALEPGFLRFAESARTIMGFEMAEALQERHRVNRLMTAFFQRYELLLSPTVAAPPFAKAGPPPSVIGGREVGPTGYIPFTYPFNLTGHPAASLPSGTADGMPAGLQVVGPRYAEKLVLAASAAYEAVRPWSWPA